MPAVPNVDRHVSVGDAWTLRGAVFIYGLYSASILVDGLAKKLRKASNVSERVGVLRTMWLFILLGTLGLYCILVFMMRTILDDPSGTLRSWVCMLSIGHAVYCAAETQISFSRMPTSVLGARTTTTFVLVVRFGILIAIARSVVNIVNITYWFGKSLDDPQHGRYQSLDLATTIFNMVGSACFFLTELYVYYLTIKISHMTTNPATIRTMKVLAKANIYGSLAGLVDIGNEYYQIQTLEAIVLCLGMTAFIYYGRLLRPDNATGSTYNDRTSLVASPTKFVTVSSHPTYEMARQYSRHNLATSTDTVNAVYE